MWKERLRSPDEKPEMEASIGIKDGKHGTLCRPSRCSLQRHGFRKEYTSIDLLNPMQIQKPSVQDYNEKLETTNDEPTPGNVTHLFGKTMKITVYILD